MNDYIIVVKLETINKIYYYLFRSTYELRKFLNNDFIFDFISILAMYRELRTYCEKRGFKYYYDN